MSWIKHQNIVLFGLSASAVAAVCWYIHRERKRQKEQYNSNKPSVIHIVKCRAEWDKLYPSIMEELQYCKVLGFDCEWVTLTYSRCPVSLLQLATPSGVCILIQLIQMDEIPGTLLNLLADKMVLKAGVGCLNDGRQLLRDHAMLVQGCVDLRHVVLRARIPVRGVGLKALSSSLLGVELDKNLLVRAGNWELENLTQQQVDYAAMDALVGVNIFLVAVNTKLGRYPRERTHPIEDEQTWSRVVSMCQGIVDIPYSNADKAAMRLLEEDGQTHNVKKSTDTTSVVRGRTVPSRPSRAYKHRQRPLYYNCQLQAPDGQLLCTCDLKKAEWYMEKGLGEKVSDDPLTIRLAFEPSGRPISDKNYYLQEKVNKCVVCGAEESYIRKSIVPHDYRKHFPSLLKEHRSHDIVLLCATCHQHSNLYDAAVVDSLAVKCHAPTAASDSVKFRIDHGVQRVKSAAKALMNEKAHIPETRKEELREVVRTYYGLQELARDTLIQATQLDDKLPNHNYVSHGEVVVRYITEHEGLVEFERMWRKHFLDTMKPKHLPPMWSVDHNVQDLKNMSDSITKHINTT